MKINGELVCPECKRTNPNPIREVEAPMGTRIKVIATCRECGHKFEVKSKP